MSIAGRYIRKFTSAIGSHLCIASLLLILAAGESTAHEVCDSATIRFKVSHSRIDMSLGHNRAELDSLTTFMDRYGKAGSAYTLRSVRVVGGASPEGSISINERLSRRRAASIFDYISDREKLNDSITTFEYLGRDWQGLRSAVEFDTRVPYRRDVLALLDEILTSQPVSSEVSDNGLARLRTMHGGVPYNYLLIHVFPQLRASTLYVEYVGRPALPAIVPVTDSICLPVGPVNIDIPERLEPIVPLAASPRRPFYMSLKTNLLYDALALPSLGAEFYVGKNWSVGINWTYGWWDKDNIHRYWRAYGGDIYVRRWFGRKAEEKPLTGHHLGLYAGVVTYDFEFGGRGYMGGLPHRSLWSRCNYLGGIEYGYSLPVARRLNIDFTVGIGYMCGDYLEYIPEDNHYVWQATKRHSWVGPTKAEISLVWLIGYGNQNSRKGGAK